MNWPSRVDIKARDDGRTYLRRWRLLSTAWCGVYVHKIMEPDWTRDMHDHPWPFVSIVLCGGYYEVVSQDGRYRHITRWNRKRADDAHFIADLDRTPTWTLIVRGPRRRGWGFVTADGWVPQHEYQGGEVR